MNGELRCSRTERVRTDAGRVAIAAVALTLGLAPTAAANAKGNGSGNGNAGSPPAHAGQQGPPPHANNDNGNRPASQTGGTRGNSGNAPGRSQGNPTPGTRPSQAPPSWSNAGGRPPSSTPAPAPRGGNDTPKKSERENNGAAHQKTTICHATGSATNPYVEITISDRALKAHAAHQDGRDIIPAPGGGCPKAEVTNAATEAIAGLAPAFDAAIPGPPAVAGATASGSGEAGATAGRPVAAGDVAGVEAEGVTPADGAAADTAAASNGPDKGEEGGSLPFTGLAVVMLAIAGALLIATGLGLKRSHATRA